MRPRHRCHPAGLQKLIPCTDTYDGDRFITQVNGVRRFTPLLLVLAVIEISGDTGDGALPLRVPACLVNAQSLDPWACHSLGDMRILADVIFAVDSIPAVFGVTLDPFIIYTSNIFAILSLRSLYTFVADVMDGLHLLDKVRARAVAHAREGPVPIAHAASSVRFPQSIALVLGFIGVKLVLEFLGYDIPTSVSLGVVASLLGGGVALSYVIPTGDAKQSSDSK